MLIIVKNVCKSYENNQIFHQFSCSIADGERICILGGSGVGKTTFFRLLLGLEKPDSGEISVLSSFQKSVVFQEDRLLEKMTVAGNIFLPHLKKSTEITKTELEQGLTALGMAEKSEMTVSELSGGMKRRVAILRAILAPYDIIFMDEPFKGLDIQTKMSTMDFVSEKTEGKTMLWITHDPTELEFLPCSQQIKLGQLTK